MVEKIYKRIVCVLTMSSLECRLLQKLHLKRLDLGPKDNSLFFLRNVLFDYFFMAKKYICGISEN